MEINAYYIKLYLYCQLLDKVEKNLITNFMYTAMKTFDCGYNN